MYIHIPIYIYIWQHRRDMREETACCSLGGSSENRGSGPRTRWLRQWQPQLSGWWRAGWTRSGRGMLRCHRTQTALSNGQPGRAHLRCSWHPLCACLPGSWTAWPRWLWGPYASRTMPRPGLALLHLIHLKVSRSFGDIPDYLLVLCPWLLWQFISPLSWLIIYPPAVFVDVPSRNLHLPEHGA